MVENTQLDIIVHYVLSVFFFNMSCADLARATYILVNTCLINRLIDHKAFDRAVLLLAAVFGVLGTLPH